MAGTTLKAKESWEGLGSLASAPSSCWAGRPGGRTALPGIEQQDPAPSTSSSGRSRRSSCMALGARSRPIMWTRSTEQLLRAGGLAG